MDIISAKYSTSNYDSDDEPLSDLTQNNLSSSKDNRTNRMLEALAVGPRGENMDVLLDLVKQVFHTHETARKEYLPNDTHHITKDMKESESFQKTQEMLQEKLDTLNNRLKEYSVPFSGFLHLANMVPDPTIPAFAGYIAGMLYNQNNLSGEAGQSTIHIEIEVANKILEMFNFPEFQSLEPEHLKDPAKIEPWCHLTPGGTIGNLEAFWGARAVKFYPLAARRALTEDNLLSSIAKKIMVKTAKGESKLLVECSAWELINICCDEALCLTRRIYDSLLAQNRRKRKISLVDIYKTIISYSIQQEGVLSTFEYLHNIDAENKENRIKNPVYFASSTAHYSMLKCSALIGSGTKSFKLVKVDKASRLDIDDLEKQLEKCVETRTPVFITVAIMGTTVESAVDPLSDILDLRAKFRKEHGLDFNIHVDAAYGAYFASLLKPYPGRPDYNIRKDDLTAIARASLNEYSAKQYRRINEADTLTLDPHKTGYIPYPCGASIQRNHLLKNLLHFEGPYTSGSVVGFYGIEGSKGGAAACSAWLAHECLPLHIGGHGSLLGLILYNTKRFYARLMDIGFQVDKNGNLGDVPIRVVPLAKLPEERKDNPDMKEVYRQYQSVIHDIARKSDQELTQRIYEDDDFADFFNEVGPDLGVLCYHLNFKIPQTGEWNRSLAAANMFNQKLYEKMSVKWQDPKNPQSVKDLPVVVTKTSISRSRESESLYDDMLARTNCDERMGDQDSATGITLLKTAMMQPFISETTSGSLFDVVIQEFTKVAREVLTDNQALWTIESAGL